MPARADVFDLAHLTLQAGEARRLELEVELGEFTFGTDRYGTEPQVVPVQLELARMIHQGWSLRLRFEAAIAGPCMRCLEPAAPVIEVDAREIDQPGGGEELESPYVDGEELDLRRWAHDAFALALPAQVLCRADCAGLCPRCGVNLNADPDHAHEPEKDPRWAALDALTFDEPGED